jgi:hypothetical protein
LLFGKEAKLGVWLVTAGEAFYADTNGDGDLTKPSKRIYSVGNYRVLNFLDYYGEDMWLPVPENERVYQVGDVFDPTSRTWYNVTVRRSGKLASATFEFWVMVQQRLLLLGQLERFSDRRDDAPVLHFDGPLTLGLFTKRLVRGAGNDLEAWFGTDVPAEAQGQPTYVVHNREVPNYVFPLAGIEFAERRPAGKTFSTDLPLSLRQNRVRFSGRLRVPDTAGDSAKIDLSISNSIWRIVRPAKVEVPVVDAHSDRSSE